MKLRSIAAIVSTLLAGVASAAVAAPVSGDFSIASPIIIGQNQIAVDFGAERVVTLPESVRAKPVVIGSWDSHTDVDLFKTATIRGIAFDKDANPTTSLVRVMGEAAPRMVSLTQYMRGSLDLRAAIDPQAARALMQAEVDQSQEDLSTPTMWAHGTHVAYPRESVLFRSAHDFSLGQTSVLVGKAGYVAGEKSAMRSKPLFLFKISLESRDA
ncbi:MAG: hypothetical protein ING75_04575 [Rhodocyclaceae bacterium]|nr:hypothetical protein [Rhodocyclaceae bacterium]